MPYKNKEHKNEYNKLRLQKIRKNVVPVVPNQECFVVPVVPNFFHDIRRFELLFDTIRMRKLLSKKTNFNLWMNKHLDILDEIKLKHINEYKTNVLNTLKTYLATINNIDNI